MATSMVLPKELYANVGMQVPPELFANTSTFQQSGAGTGTPPNLTFSPTVGTFDPTGYGMPQWDRTNPWATRLDVNAYNRTPLAALDPNATAFSGAPFQFDGQQFAFRPGSGEALLANDPGYKFRMDEGRKALEASAAARGGLFSGATGKAIQNYAQGLASQEYGNAYNRALGENQMAYGRALGENEMGYGRALGENQLWHTRLQEQNMTDEQRQAAANEQRYQRDYRARADDYSRLWDYETDLYNRTFQQNQMNYQRGYQQNQDQFQRELLLNNMDWQRGTYADETAYNREYQQSQDDYNRRLQQYLMNTQNEMAMRQQRYNELAGLSGTGQNAQTLLANLGSVLGQQRAGNITGAGAAGAAGAIARGNTWADVLQYLAQMGRNYV